VFIGAGGDEEADISVGAMRFAKWFEGGPSTDIEFLYESFPGETHGSVGYRRFYRALEVLGQPDAAAHEAPARYLSEAQRRRPHGSGGSVRHSEKSLCLCSRSRGPVLDQLSTGHNADFGTFCDRLQKEHGDDFRFDPLSGRT